MSTDPSDSERLPMPQATSERARRAIARHQGRFATPPLEVTGSWNDWSFGNPFREEDNANWRALILEAFGTRSFASAEVFIRQLARLVDTEDDTWQPKVDELNAAINIVASVEPSNEFQAALAAQLVALHITAMGLARKCATMAEPDERTAATLARVSKASASLASTIAGLKGGRTTRHETHVHHHTHDERHLHLGEGADFGAHPHAKGNAYGELRSPADARLTALPGAGEDHRTTMSSSRSEGQARLSDARWFTRLWSSVGRAQR